MFQEYFARNPQLLVWPLIGLGIFLASFVGVLLYTFFGLRDRKKVTFLASLPLVPDSPHPDTRDREETS